MKASSGSRIDGVSIGLKIGTLKRFIPHFVVLSIWVSVLVYASFSATVKSPVTVASSFHIVSASTQCDASITCSVLDVFQPSCTVASATSVNCGGTTVQAGESYDIIVNVAGGVPGSSHSWTAASTSSIVTPTPPSGSYVLTSTGTGSFSVKVTTSIGITGTDTVTVTVT
jgi:hypothetical protein